MSLFTNIAFAGQANPNSRFVDMVQSNEDEVEEKKISKPPIVHELMHMISMSIWGRPSGDLTWLNEGLATYANNDCSGYSVAEIYRFFLAEDILLPMEIMAGNFYSTEEMIGYHQAAYIAQYLIETYGIEKLERLWKSGFSAFEQIYGQPYNEVEKAINKRVVEQYPNIPEIDWEVLKEGCE